jgi:hypothetical protein
VVAEPPHAGLSPSAPYRHQRVPRWHTDRSIRPDVTPFSFSPAPRSSDPRFRPRSVLRSVRQGLGNEVWDMLYNSSGQPHIPLRYPGTLPQYARAGRIRLPLRIGEIFGARALSIVTQTFVGTLKTARILLANSLGLYFNTIDRCLWVGTTLATST